MFQRLGHTGQRPKWFRRGEFSAIRSSTLIAKFSGGGPVHVRAPVGGAALRNSFTAPVSRKMNVGTTADHVQQRRDNREELNGGRLREAPPRIRSKSALWSHCPLVEGAEYFVQRLLAPTVMSDIARMARTVADRLSDLECPEASRLDSGAMRPLGKV